MFKQIAPASGGVACRAPKWISVEITSEITEES